MEGSVINVGLHRRLRRQIGEPVEPSSAIARPAWDSDLGELKYQGNLIRKVKGNAPSIRAILDAFQEMSWPARIDNPLPGGPISRTLRNTLYRLNKNLQGISFFADGTATGILWQAK